MPKQLTRKDIIEQKILPYGDKFLLLDEVIFDNNPEVSTGYLKLTDSMDFVRDHFGVLPLTLQIEAIGQLGLLNALIINPDFFGAAEHFATVQVGMLPLVVGMTLEIKTRIKFDSTDQGEKDILLIEGEIGPRGYGNKYNTIGTGKIRLKSKKYFEKALKNSERLIRKINKNKGTSKN